MQEKDILAEKGDLWLAKTGHNEYTLFKNGLTHSKGFLQFTNKIQALDNLDALSKMPDTVAKLIRQSEKGN